jgi:hypothetical protein
MLALHEEGACVGDTEVGPTPGHGAGANKHVGRRVPARARREHACRGAVERAGAARTCTWRRGVAAALTPTCGYRAVTQLLGQPTCTSPAPAPVRAARTCMSPAPAPARAARTCMSPTPAPAGAARTCMSLPTAPARAARPCRSPDARAGTPGGSMHVILGPLGHVCSDRACQGRLRRHTRLVHVSERSPRRHARAGKRISWPATAAEAASGPVRRRAGAGRRPPADLHRHQAVSGSRIAARSASGEPLLRQQHALAGPER